MPKKLTPEDYHALAAMRGFKWIGESVQSSGIKTLWECPRGHQWECRYDDIKQGIGCKYCSNQYQKTPDDYVALALRKGYKWLGPVVNSTKAKTRWLCPQGHEVIASFNQLSRRKGQLGCARCYGNQRHQPANYHELAENRGLKWLGPEVKNVGEKTRWRCKFGHEWVTSYFSLSCTTRGCPVCSRSAQKTAGDYAELADVRGFIWLGPMTANSRQKTGWQCLSGHTWQAPYHDISGGHSCPHCKDKVNGQYVSKPQRLLCTMLGGVLNYRLERYCIDVAIFINEIPIAVEYDCWYWHQKKRDSDAKRDAFLQQTGWRVLRVKSGQSLPTQSQLDEAIALLLSGATYAEIVLPDWKEEGGS